MSESQLPPASGTILFVDDEVTVRDVGRQILALDGHQVIEACDGQQAVDLFREHQAKIDLVIMDMTMPEMSGIEAFEAIRELSDDVPILLSSGFQEEDLSPELLKKGLSGFLRKPYDIHQLLALVRNLI